MSVRALLVPVDSRNPIRRIVLRGNEERQVAQIQKRVGGWLELARVVVIPDDLDNAPGSPETWIYAAVHETGMLDGLPPNLRLSSAFGAHYLYGDAVLTAARSTDGTSCDLPPVVENRIESELGERIENGEEQ